MERFRFHFAREDWQYLWMYIRPRLRSIGSSIFGLILLNHASFINLWVVAFVIGKVIPSGVYTKVLWLAAFYFVSNLLISFLNVWYRKRMIESTGSLVNDIRKDVMVSILSGNDLGIFHRDTRLYQSRLVNESRHLNDALVMLMGQTLPSAVLVCTTLILVGGINMGLMLLLLVAIPFYLVLLRVRGASLYKKIRAKNKAENRYQSHVSLVLHFLDHIRIRMSESLELKLHDDRLMESKRANLDYSIGVSKQGFANSVFHTILFLSVLLFGTRSVINAGMGLDRLVVLLLAVNTLYSMSGSLLTGYSKLLTMGESLHELRCLVSEAGRAVLWSGLSPMPAYGSFSFRKVSFGYADLPILQDIDFDMVPGTCVALMGSNGAGKTTLVHLLLGLLRPGGGSVRYGGIDLVDIDMKAYRSSIGYVPQRPRIMPGTVRENLSYAIDDISEDSLHEALRLAMAEDLVRRLPNGLDTQIGEEGVRLSGGERQRLAIAAALVGRPRILVLDEPTNHLDADAIRQLIVNIKGLHDSPTILFVSHNREMLSMADRILSLEQGRLREIDMEEYLNPAAKVGKAGVDGSFRGAGLTLH